MVILLIVMLFLYMLYMYILQSSRWHVYKEQYGKIFNGFVMFKFQWLLNFLHMFQAAARAAISFDTSCVPSVYVPTVSVYYPAHFFYECCLFQPGCTSSKPAAITEPWSNVEFTHPPAPSSSDGWPMDAIYMFGTGNEAVVAYLYLEVLSQINIGINVRYKFFRQLYYVYCNRPGLSFKL